MTTTVSPSPCNFLLLLFLLFIHGIIGREIATKSEQKIEAPHDDDDHNIFLKHGDHECNKEINHIFPEHMDAQSLSSSSSSSSPSSSHMELSWNIFFHIDDLKIGKRVPLYFPIKNISTTPHMIPKKEAESIPFSSNQLPKILEYFSFPQNSPQAKAIEHTLKHCEIRPLKGETKFCATSLESMLDNLSLIFGLGTNFKVLTTTSTTTHVKNMVQNYSIVEDPKEITAPKIVGCHPVAYPYAVYYCHGQVSDNKLFLVSFESEVDKVRVEAVAMCHMDTSQWDRNHVAFRVLGFEPGTSPVCHVFPHDNLVWVSSLNLSAD